LIISYVKSNNRYKRFLREARDQAERLANVKKEFLANMSHEIRTPINAVMGFTEQLNTTRLDEQQKKFVSIIHNSTEHLLSLINSILDHSRLEAGKMVFNKIPFNIREMTEQISEMFTPLVREKKIILRTEIEPIASEWITGDPDRLRQVLINLIGNSVKFTNSGSITLKILRNETNGLLVEVSDEGIGIPQEQLRQIFESFKQADAYTTRKFGGTGLGLTICKQIVEQQNGWIIVESEPGVGSVFRFFLPYSPAAEPVLVLPDVELKPVKPNFKKLEGVKIFGADDELYNRNLLEAILSKTGCVFESAEDGDMASSYLDRNKYDVILLDVRMPGKSGTELARIVRKNKSHINNNTPIVALTAGVSKEEMEECHKSGINFVIAKPFTEAELFGVLGKLLNGNVKPSTIKNKNMSNPNGKSFTLEELMMIANGDVDFVKQMIKIFISSTAENIRQLEMAFQEDDVPAIGNIAHKMAAPCRHLGMQDLASLLKVIERKAFERSPINILEPYLKDALKQARHNMEELRDTYDKLPLTHNISSQ
jgi:nitrogen-specific signal transduction histidine kinase/CheY-like chemotaxis protein